ncbi:Protein of unknown function (DUF3558) [Streptoalloteichus tenebrarius]|uniref:DUF3558 domain-containing protein n=1 Tax=Streptoalloteichus tenebrarius (strain ATCC 17920 / DSM 40477 / JCM 4838 / CBS 697.72 / NBRC 16177 / NCIMB 11028 / NRRL B-12390 / A12253. 1 / ISP 5477) TaxID=1933 RepID=A0ABT1HVD8_STRSD|nr:DUF3558 domain-containing protein [Streptoalloteichus tenebrarius]MCP2259432.1 Protein of unknown function (DUF3558) [Streptoalloteichus tenebrarius]BFF02375.1 hypothetical protein GCM10020241_40500 [Streptoalloteichus tenebrarius]
MAKRIIKLVVPILGVVPLVACGPTTGDAQLTGGSSTTSGTETSAREVPSGVPRVAKPLDVTKYTQNPCSVLTSTQLRAFNVQSAGEPGKNTDPYCRWSDSSGPSNMSFTVTIATSRDGLAAVYRNRENFTTVFEQFDAEGYPGVLLGGKEVSLGMCDSEVGVSDKLSFSVTVRLSQRSPDSANPCRQVKALATEIVKTMKGQG